MTYSLMLLALLPWTTSTTPTTSHVVDGVIGTFHAQPQSHMPLTPIPNPMLLMFKLLRLLLLPPVKLRKLMSFNLPLPVKINLKKERVRIRRIKIIIRNLTRPRHNLLMIRINANLDILALSVVMITTRKIVQDVSRSQSSFKGP
jgi:hypothetical protein